ncbi:hypothetical protein [Flavobacterium alkalisoli]|uniref:hypothetical protein n=1 Tax=Flavobacterium alkalisoli TaxID=2602769 RepID=UPI003A94E5BD
MNKKIHIDIPDEKKFLNQLQNNSLVEISADYIFDEGYDVEPHVDYETPEGFPNCCEYHINTKKNLDEWFNRFPDCCERHAVLQTKRWFNKNRYNHVVDKILLLSLHTANFIKQNIDAENWYKEITDYIDYCNGSFGEPEVGGERYCSGVEHYIAVDEGELFTPENKWKQSQILAFFRSYKTVDVNLKKETDLNLLESTFQKWLKFLPSISVFSEIKENYTGRFPLTLVLRDPEHNRFTGLTKFSVRTKNELLEILVKETRNILEHITNLNLYKNGNISFKAKYELDLISQAHELKQKKLLSEYSKSESRYVKILKKWLTNEKQFIEDLKPLLTKEEKKIVLKTEADFDKIYEQIVDQIFYFGVNLEKSKRVYQNFDEESFRDYFLPYLNSISENFSATGETFNKIGKTDILIQDNNGINIFIGECKLWKGENELKKALDQLFERYVNWRDEKVALIIFNTKHKDFTKLISKANYALREHKLFKKYLGERQKSSFKYLFMHNEDNEKIVNLELIILNCI